MYRVSAVSYTHLDVYKRQVFRVMITVQLLSRQAGHVVPWLLIYLQETGSLPARPPKGKSINITLSVLASAHRNSVSISLFV